MRVEVRVDGGEQELRSLYDWLRQDAAVRRGARVSMPAAPAGPESMGAFAEVLQLVTDNAWSAASFALALSTWRQTRPARRRVTVQRGGTTVVVENGGDEEVSRLIRVLEEAADDDTQGEGHQGEGQ
ncbi:hypothetical protein ACFUIW_21805 [Streptomyces sp. NPDC057245]|uniref:effector-associated constant component EACC1 n=1 Tax=Streptomyces TaxID=1883 RepID=UPI001C1DF287|nr:hypothetical protein [Streptomyces sp. A108]MBU6531876.1 hypothetical protein [Streptomyces sp. A108]